MTEKIKRGGSLKNGAHLIILDGGMIDVPLGPKGNTQAVQRVASNTSLAQVLQFPTAFRPKFELPSGDSA